MTLHVRVNVKWCSRCVLALQRCLTLHVRAYRLLKTKIRWSFTKQLRIAMSLCIQELTNNMRLLDQASNLLNQRVGVTDAVLNDVTTLSNDVSSLQRDVSKLQTGGELQGNELPLIKIWNSLLITDFCLGISPFFLIHALALIIF